MKKGLLIILISASCSLIVTAQNVGVSNATGLTPQSLLHVHNTAIGRLLQLTNANTGSAATDGFQVSIDGSYNIVFNQYEAAKMAFYTNNTERLTILSGGNVGIGTNLPVEALEVNGKFKIGNNTVAGENVTFDGTTSAGLRLSNSSGYISLTPLNASWAHIYTDRNNFIFNKTVYSIVGNFSAYNTADLQLQTNGTTRIIVKQSNGNVGIGTASPAAKLDVNGTVQMTGFKLATAPSSGYVLVTDANGNGTWQSVATGAGAITGSCSSGANYLPKMSSTTAITCSQIFDNGTNVGIGTSTLPQKLSVEGGIHVKDGSYLDFVNWQWAMGRDINSTFSTGNELQVLGYGSSGNSFQIIGITGSSPSYTYSRIFQANLDNGNVGIGTSPANKLDVEGGAVIGATYSGTNTAPANGMLIEGNVGIGTINPAANLDNGGVTAGGALRTVFARMSEGNSTGSGTFLGIKAWETQNTSWGGKMFSIENTFYGNLNSSIEFYRGGSTTGGFMTFTTNDGTERLRIDPSGNVGIGTTSPSARLHTTGTVRFQNYTSGTLQVDANGNLSVGSGSNVFNAGTGLSWSGNTLNSLWTANGNNIYNNNSGNVGIGTTSPAAKLEVAGGVRVGNGFNISIPNTCGGNWITSADMAIWTSDHTGGCGDEAYIAHYVRGTTGEATTLEIGNKNDADDHIALMPSGNVGIGTNNPDDKLDVVGNSQVSGYLKVGNPATPSSVASNTPLALFSWNNQSGIYNLLSTSGCGATDWYFLIDGLSSYYEYDNGGSRAFKPLMTPWVWVPTTSTGVMIELNFYNSLEWEYDGVYVEYTTDGSTWTLVNSWNYGSYNHASIDGSNSSCSADINSSGWTDTGDEGPWSTILPLNGKWVRFRLVAIEDESNSTGTFELYGLTIWAENAGSLGGSFTDGNIYAQKNVYAGSNVLMGDVAEYFNVKGISLPGQLISLNINEKDAYMVSSKKYDPNVIGIHSTAPTLTINSPNSGIPVALTGRVPVFVNNENGKISQGDYLTASSRPGYACKATEACYVIGQALENFDDREGKIICLLKQNWYMPYAQSNTGSGNFFISKGKDKITIIDKKVSEKSKVFLTMLGNPQQNYWISEKANGSFTISFSGEVFQDLNFDYFIDNANNEPAEEPNKILSNDEYVSVHKPLDFDRGGWQFDKKKNIYWRPEPEKNYTSRKEVEMISDEEPAPPKPEDENSGYIFYKNELIKTIDLKIHK